MKKERTNFITKDILESILKLKKMNLLNDKTSYGSNGMETVLKIYDTGKFSFSNKKYTYIWEYKETGKLLLHYNNLNGIVVINPQYILFTAKEKNATAFILKQLPVNYKVVIGDFNTVISEIKLLHNILQGGL